MDKVSSFFNKAAGIAILIMGIAGGVSLYSETKQPAKTETKANNQIPQVLADLQPK